jgi:hypothetical protein
MTIFDIREYGAVGDSVRVNTAEIQAAIDACSQGGGGTVRVDAGVYRTGTVTLKDNTHLEVCPGAVLQGSPDISDYPPGHGKHMYRERVMGRCLLFADGARNIGISGSGTIDGNGAVFPNEGDSNRNRPMLIRFMNATGIRVRDVTLSAPASWTSAWLYCRDIVVDGITIHSRVRGNGDGLDFDGCTNVRVSNSAFDTSDDSICLQTSRPDRPCRDITVTNCTFCSKWAGMRIGLLSRGDFENVCVSNCTFRDIDDAGLKIQVCEGGTMRNMSFSNLTMQNVPRPIFMTLGQQRCCVDAPDELPPIGRIQRLRFSDFVVDNSELGLDSHIVLTGVPDGIIEDITLSGIDLISAGGASEEVAAVEGVPELTPDNLDGWWPEYRCFNRILPASGLYARHVHRLGCHNLKLRTIKPDARPVIVMEDVTLVRPNVCENEMKTGIG